MGFASRFCFSVLAAASVVSACVTDHTALEKKPDHGSGGSSAAGRGGSAGFGNFAGSGGKGGSGGRLDDEPPGENVLTLLHGAVDAERIAFCFAKYDRTSHRAIQVGDPIPSAGLQFGHRISIRSLPDLDFATDALQPFVIAGDLELVADLDCEQAVALAEAEEQAPSALAAGGASGDAGGGGDPSSAGQGGGSGAGGEGGAPSEPPLVKPLLRVRSLPVLPEGTLNGGRSYLFVAAGCLGGPYFTDAIDQELCGIGYRADAPTLTPIVVALARRVEFGDVGLQVVHASLATGEFDLRATPPPDSGDVSLTIASDVTLGAVTPRPPRFGLTASELGVSSSDWTVDVLMEGATKSEAWPTIIDRGDNAALENSKTYALVVVGPRADIGGFKWWNQAVITAIPTDPE